MGGFPNPRNCSKCVCPGGYGGDHCNERPKGDCGRTIEALPEWNTLTDTLGDVNVLKPLQDFTVCNYWINSPPETEIEIILLSLSNSFDVDGCVYDGVEIKANQDQRLSGYRCSLHIVAVNLCNNDRFTDVQKRTYCPKACNLCSTPQSINAAT
ncbi:hypothetical protein TELCIR_18553 [Teladorsagia circumcincta]|uniref:CUB domain-containing protein n=1 Tax=Teladorsagia circumcincta TaxID=45464 RepID=A0A2G9TPU8_TELCI|nr:hypothetical protein TELCIR_18553 [Teladorsagia circumcincta]